MKTKLIAGCILSFIIFTNVAFNKFSPSGKFQQKEYKNYRIYEGDSYQILDTAAFYLYYRYVSEEKIKGKSLSKSGKYFFSMNAGSPIQDLTLDNLERSYPDNLTFHYALESFFRTNQDLVAYDRYCNCYKVKYLYKQSLK